VLRDARKGSLALGLLCLVLGVTAMVGGALPGWTLLRWGTPVLLLALGAIGLARHRPTRGGSA
jgi:hypothetical protein